MSSTKRLYLLLLSATLGAASLVTAAVFQATSRTGWRIVVGPNIAVTNDPRAVRTESWVAADPSDPRHLVGAVTTTRGATEHTRFDSTQVSFDGGNTWSEIDAAGALRLSDGDPQVTFAPKGELYFATLSAFSRQPSVLVFRSGDGGRTWIEPPSHAPYVDHDRLAVDFSAQHRGRLYIAGEGEVRSLLHRSWPLSRDSAAFLFYSDDGGRTFSSPSIVTSNDLPRGNPYRGGGDSVEEVLVLSSGDVVVGVSRYQYPHPAYSTNQLSVFISHDGGHIFGPERFIAKFHVIFGRYGGPVSHFDAPEFAADLSQGKFQNRIYAVWDNVVGQYSRLFLAYSLNHGESWSTPRQIDTSALGPGDDYQANIAVNTRGIIGLVFYHGRNAVSYDRFSEPRDRYDAYFTASVDGSRTFLPVTRVSSQTSSPNTEENWRPFFINRDPGDPRLSAWFSSADKWSPQGGGDYIGIAADAKGAFHPMWIDSRSGVYQLYTCAVSVVKDGTVAPVRAGGIENLNRDVRVLFGPTTIDHGGTEVILPVRVQNISTQTIGPVLRLKGSLYATQENLGPLPRMFIANGPTKDYSHALGAGGQLKPHEFSDTVFWHLRASDPTTWDYFRVSFNVVGTLWRASDRYASYQIK